MLNGLGVVHRALYAAAMAILEALASWSASPNCDDRLSGQPVDSIVLHSISLPPGDYSKGDDEDHPVIRFFQNRLDYSLHPYFEQLQGVTVSSHFFIRRCGRIIQLVDTDQRAWHAGESYHAQQCRVNDRSVGIELEGWDEADDGYEEAQYKALRELLSALRSLHPELKRENVMAHSDIALGRKFDPGPYFDWPAALREW